MQYIYRYIYIYINPSKNTQPSIGNQDIQTSFSSRRLLFTTLSVPHRPSEWPLNDFHHI